MEISLEMSRFQRLGRNEFRSVKASGSASRISEGHTLSAGSDAAEQGETGINMPSKDK